MRDIFHHCASIHSGINAMKRRDFLRQSAATIGVFSFPAILRSASPNSMLQVACIGVGGMGATR